MKKPNRGIVQIGAMDFVAILAGVFSVPDRIKVPDSMPQDFSLSRMGYSVQDDCHYFEGLSTGFDEESSEGPHVYNVSVDNQTAFMLIRVRDVGNLQWEKIPGLTDYQSAAVAAENAQKNEPPAMLPGMADPLDPTLLMNIFKNERR